MSGLVVDASALAEHLVGSPDGRRVSAILAQHAAEGLHLPHLAIVETAAVLRGWVGRGVLPGARAAGALADLADFPAVRWPTEPLLTRMWELRDNVAAYDSCYVALAEALDCALLTGDRRLQRSAARVARCAVISPDPEGGLH